MIFQRTIHSTAALLFLLTTTVLNSPCRAYDGPSLKLLFAVTEAGRGISLQKPGSIVVDTLKGEVYLTDRVRKQVLVYKESGEFLQVLGKDAGMAIPYGLLFDPSGALIVGEQDLPELWILDLTGKVLKDIRIDSGTANDFRPGGMSLDSESNILVVNRYGRSVIRVDRSTQSANTWYSGPGKDPYDQMVLQDVIRTRQGRTVLLSSIGNAVRILDGSGKAEVEFGEHGSREDQFSFPSAFALGPEGNLWIVDTFQHKIKVFSQDGTFVRQYGKMGTEPGSFFFPVDMTFGSRGEVFILEKGIARFQAFGLTR